MRGPRALLKRELLERVVAVTAELQACRTQAAQAERLRRLGTWSLDLDTNHVTWSDGTYRIFGVPSQTPVTLERALSFYPGEAQATLSDALAAALEFGTSWDLTLPFVGVRGELGWVRTLGQAETQGTGRRLVGVVEDVTVEKLATDRLRSLAHSDPLTGIHNRRAFQQRLEALADRHATPGTALLLVDVDCFKVFNDTVGHAAGDNLLKQVAGRLQVLAKPDDVVARIGGDEFAMILAGSGGAGALAVRAAEVVEAIRSFPAQGDGAIRPSVSVGAARTSDSDGSADDLLRCADLALYRAKALGRGRAEIYSPRLRARMDEQTRLLQEVREAIRQQRICAVYQPIVDLRTGLVRGVEALARWDHPTRGVLPPSEFAAALADPVLSVEIDDLMLRAALAQMRVWLDDAVPIAAVNVNLSEGQLRRPDLVEHVTALLAANGLSPEHLKFEVLETALLGRDTEQVARTVGRLSQLGIVCALDDFGTGYASLAHLRQFRVERLKIDRSFVAGIVSDPFDRALTRSLIDLGHNLGIRVTAEGVETPEQLALLNTWGCDCAQGYLIGRPTAAAGMPEVVARWYARYAAGLCETEPQPAAQAGRR